MYRNGKITFYELWQLLLFTDFQRSKGGFIFCDKKRNTKNFSPIFNKREMGSTVI